MAKTACQSVAGFQRYKLLKSVMVLSGRSCEKNPVSGEDSRALRARRSLVTNCLHAAGHFRNSQEQVIDCRDESVKASQYLFFSYLWSGPGIQATYSTCCRYNCNLLSLSYFVSICSKLCALNIAAK